MVLDDSRSWLLKKCVTCIILQGNSYLIRFQDGTKFSLVTGKWHLSATQPRKHRRFGRVEVSSVQFSALLLWLSDVSVDYSHFQFISLHLLLPRRVQHLPLDSPSPKFLLAVISFKIQLLRWLWENASCLPLSIHTDRFRGLSLWDSVALRPLTVQYYNSTTVICLGLSLELHCELFGDIHHFCLFI